MSLKLLKVSGDAPKKRKAFRRGRFGSAEPEWCASIRAALVAVALCVATAPSPSFAAPSYAVWVGGDATAPNDPTVLANWTAPDGSALTELPASTTVVTNQVSDEAKIPIISNGMDIDWLRPYIGFYSGNSGKLKMTGGTLSIYSMNAGYKGGIGEFEQTGGEVTIDSGSGDLNAHSRFGQSGIGTLTITGGKYTSTRAMTHIGHGAANQVADGNGTMNVGGDAVVKLKGLYLGISENNSFGKCNGLLKIYGNGSLTLNNALYLSYGKNNDQRGKVEQTGGKLSTPAQYIGYKGRADYVQTGGTNTASGVITLAGANQVVANYVIGPGELFANGGIVLAANGATFKANTDQGAVLTLNEGGIVTTTQIQRGTTSGNHYARVVCNGGKIVAKNDNAAFFKNLEFTYNAAGVTIDTKTFNVTATGCTTFSSAAEGSAVRKVGAGKLSYSALPLVDEIAVQEGTLAITANANVTSRSANRISVASGAAFDLGGFTLAARSLAGAGAVSNGTITVAGTLAPDGTFAFGDNTAATLSGSLALDSGETVTLGTGSTLDLSSATIVLGENETVGWTFAKGPAGSITGTSAVTGPKGYHVKISADGSSAKVFRKGLVIVVR